MDDDADELEQALAVPMTRAQERALAIRDLKRAWRNLADVVRAEVVAVRNRRNLPPGADQHPSAQ